jgi:hypothetical protein
VKHSPSETDRLKDLSATLGPSNASSWGSLNIHLSLKASKPIVESKVVDDCNGIHCLYVGGASQEQYPLIQGLSPKAIAGISALLGIYKLDRISGPGEYMQDFLSHCMHVEKCQKPKLTDDKGKLQLTRSRHVHTSSCRLFKTRRRPWFLNLRVCSQTRPPRRIRVSCIPVMSFDNAVSGADVIALHCPYHSCS